MGSEVLTTTAYGGVVVLNVLVVNYVASQLEMDIAVGVPIIYIKRQKVKALGGGDGVGVLCCTIASAGYPPNIGE